jgi:hypothetical protein
MEHLQLQDVTLVMHDWGGVHSNHTTLAYASTFYCRYSQ